MPIPTDEAAVRHAPRLLRDGAGALLAAAVLLGCSGDASSAQEGAVVPSERDVVTERADLSRTVGDSASPLTIVEVSDFQCPYCARHYRQTYSALDSLYVDTGKARYVFVTYPNPGHDRAWPAAEAAYCAGAVGKFWPMHDLLFEHQSAWADSASRPQELFVDYAGRIGIDRASFRSCLEHDLPSQLQVRDLEQVSGARIRSTPLFIVNGETPIVGAQPLSRFRTVLDSLLQAGAGTTRDDAAGGPGG